MQYQNCGLRSSLVRNANPTSKCGVAVTLHRYRLQTISLALLCAADHYLRLPGARFHGGACQRTNIRAKTFVQLLDIVLILENCWFRNGRFRSLAIDRIDRLSTERRGDLPGGCHDHVGSLSSTDRCERRIGLRTFQVLREEREDLRRDRAE